jgi:hypothetical protein
MLYRELIADCYEIKTKQIYTLGGQNLEFVNVKPGGTQSPYRAENTLRLGYKNQPVNAV